MSDGDSALAVEHYAPEAEGRSGNAPYLLLGAGAADADAGRSVIEQGCSRRKYGNGCLHFLLQDHQGHAVQAGIDRNVDDVRSGEAFRHYRHEIWSLLHSEVERARDLELGTATEEVEHV